SPPPTCDRPVRHGDHAEPVRLRPALDLLALGHWLAEPDRHLDRNGQPLALSSPAAAGRGASTPARAVEIAQPIPAVVIANPVPAGGDRRGAPCRPRPSRPRPPSRPTASPTAAPLGDRTRTRSPEDLPRPPSPAPR